MPEILAIVGGGHAGGSAAVAARRAGFRGRIIVLSDDAHYPYERPFLSKQFLTATDEPPTTFVHPEHRYAECRVEVVRHAPVVSIERNPGRLVLSDGRQVPFDKLIIATGGSPRAIGVPGGEAAICLRNIEDARQIRRRLARAEQVVIIGAGVIGLEVAASARSLGCEVCVVEAMDRPMARSLPGDAASVIEDMHRRAGVRFQFGTMVSEIATDGPRNRVSCANGERLPADLIVAGIGMERSVSLAATAGLALDNGIVVDEFARTSAPDILAVGDVAAFWHPVFQRRLRLESWKHAQNHGIHGGRMVAGATIAYEDLPWSWTDQYEVNVQIAGFPTEGAKSVQRMAGRSGERMFFYVDGEERVVGVVCFGAARNMRPAMRMIEARQQVDIRSLADPDAPWTKWAR